MKKLEIEKTTGEKVTLITKDNIEISAEPLGDYLRLHVHTLDNNFWPLNNKFWIRVEELVKLEIEDVIEGEN